mmetsp:Transcript_16343/g.45294  ORF Transcript_16343/g.45294 Transcript_16343/m.45294 type:complete len:103 (+) Transcript_16343:1537-1845(+)
MCDCIPTWTRHQHYQDAREGFQTLCSVRRAYDYSYSDDGKEPDLHFSLVHGRHRGLPSSGMIASHTLSEKQQAFTIGCPSNPSQVKIGFHHSQPCRLFVYQL